MKEITYLSNGDNSMQPAFLLAATGDTPRPLAVCLHTWSYALREKYALPYMNACQERNWHCIYPLFRGPNRTPEACGSDLVVSDIECAVEYMKEHFSVDENRIYLVGGSGGGHASLLMAGRRPHLWTAVSSWCPISDIKAWFTERRAAKTDPLSRGYDDDIYDACGGDPTICPVAEEQAKYRSPLTWLKNATDNVILDISAGIHDGHKGSVLVSHSLRAFNEVADEKDKISQEDIDYIVKNEKIPSHLKFNGVDPAFGSREVLFRRTSGKVRITLFEGAHDLLYETAFEFLGHQVRGKSPVWYSGDKYNEAETELSK